MRVLHRPPSLLVVALCMVGCGSPTATPGDDAGTPPPPRLDGGGGPVSNVDGGGVDAGDETPPVALPLRLTLDVPDGECVDLSARDRGTHAVRFIAEGPAGATVEIWADRPGCGVEPFFYRDVRLDSTGRGTFDLEHGGTDSCEDNLLGGWRAWLVRDDEQSASVDLAFAHPGCSGARDCATAASYCPAGDPAPPPVPTLLDDNRCRALRIADRRIDVHPVVAGDRSRLAPGAETELAQYGGKSLVIRALVHGCGEDAARLADADALLREAYVHRFPAAADCSNVNSQRGWHHARGANAIRELMLYESEIPADVMAGISEYLECALLPPQNGRSENLRWGQNMRSYLAHQILGRTSAPDYLALRDWFLDHFTRRLRDGFIEWGANYSELTLLPMLNLAEFAGHPMIRQLATAAVDMYFAEQAAQSVGLNFAAGRIRTYRHRNAVLTPVQTRFAQPLFDAPIDEPDEAMAYATQHLGLLASDWAPLLLVDRLFQRRDSYTLRHRTVGRSHYFRTNGTWALASIQNDDADYWRTDFVTHDVFPIMIQGGRDHDIMAVPFGLPHPDDPAPSKVISLQERSFAFENVAFVHHGGDCRGVWTGGGADQVPIRFYFQLGFQSPVIRDGWVFLQDRHGEIFVAWAPTVGDPRDDGEEYTWGSTRLGRYVRSTAELTEGETAVMEVSDRTESGDFASFQREILTRNPRPRLGAGRVATYTTRTGRVLRFGPDVAEVDGARQDFTTYPFNDSPVLSGHTLIVGADRVTIDPGTGDLTGRTARVPTAVSFR